MASNLKISLIKKQKVVDLYFWLQRIMNFFFVLF